MCSTLSSLSRLPFKQPCPSRSALRRLTLATLFAAVAAAGVGCTLRQTAVAYEPKAPEPLADEMSPHRNFAPVAAQYENTGIVAWHTQFPLVPAGDVRDLHRPIVEPVIFLANAVALPFTALFTEPLNEQQAWRVSALEPGHVAAVPLDAVVEVKEGANFPEFKPGLTTSDYGHAPAPLPLHHGKPGWTRPLSPNSPTHTPPAPAPTDLPPTPTPTPTPTPADLPPTPRSTPQATPIPTPVPPSPDADAPLAPLVAPTLNSQPGPRAATPRPARSAPTTQAGIQITPLP